MQKIQVELGAVCACDDADNKKALVCKGSVVATEAEFVYLDNNLGLALLQVGSVDLTHWGYLQMQPTGPQLGEPIHVIGHPRGWPQHAAVVVDSGKPGVVTNASINVCVEDEIGYDLDTQGGNSGSPVLSSIDNVVVALHNCGGCPYGPNGGVKINKLVDTLVAKKLLPKYALATSSSKPAC